MSFIKTIVSFSSGIYLGTKYHQEIKTINVAKDIKINKSGLKIADKTIVDITKDGIELFPSKEQPKSKDSWWEW